MNRARSRPLRSGFTYADVMVALLMVAILAAVAWPSLHSYASRQKLVQAGRRLAADLRWSRLRAVRKRQTITVRFSIRENSYTFPGQADPLRKQTPYRVVLGTFSPGVRIAAVSFANLRLSWSPQGLPSQAGEILLRYGSWRIRVTVNPAGTVKLSEVWTEQSTASDSTPMPMRIGP